MHTLSSDGHMAVSLQNLSFELKNIEDKNLFRADSY